MFESCTPLLWRPEIGDPTVIGWVTVAAYVLATALSFAVYTRSGQLFAYHFYANLVIRKHRLFWLALTVALAFLAVNKQLDLQSLMTEVGRCLARNQGWYDVRRGVQKEFIFVIGAAGLAVAVLLALYFRRILKDAWLAIFGFCVLITFVVMRAASLHHFDRFIAVEFLGAKVNWILELSGIAFICISALVLHLRYGPNRPDVAKKAAERAE